MTVLRSASTAHDEFEDVRDLVAHGEKVAAIKVLPDKTGWALQEAKDDFLESAAGGVRGASKASAWQKPKGRRMGLGIAGWGGGLIIAVLLGTIGMSMVRTISPSSPIRVPTATTRIGAVAMHPVTVAAPWLRTYQLALVSARGYESESGGYQIVEGQVKNISDHPQKNVTAVTTWLDDRSRLMASDDALIDYDPICPGQTSPFKTISRTNRAMSKYIVEFKTLFGGKLRVEDQR